MKRLAHSFEKKIFEYSLPSNYLCFLDSLFFEKIYKVLITR